MKIYHNPRCRKSREAVQYLTEKGVLFEIIEYLKEEISETPLCPFRIEFQTCSILFPRGERIPRPVITTLLSDIYFFRYLLLCNLQRFEPLQYLLLLHLVSLDRTLLRKP